MSKQQSEILRVLSDITSRMDLMHRLGYTYNDKRNMYESLGYPKLLSFEDYWAMYERQDIAKRIVDALPTASWIYHPEITEGKAGQDTPFENEWRLLLEEINVWHYMLRADKLSGIGMYGALLLGFDDGAELSAPVTSAGKLLYMRPYKENNAVVKRFITDKKDKRYGLPEMYQLKISTATKGNSSQTVEVHWSRVIHIADELSEDDIFGTPRLQNVFNRLLDLEKVAGGSGEMYWRGAFPGLAFIQDSDAEMDTTGQTVANLEDQISQYIHGLQRVLKLQGMKVDNLAPAIADPTSTFDVIITLIAAAKGIPKRILVGSERGELSSTQDEGAWHRRVDERRKNYLTPCIIRPFINRLISVGVLPAPKERYNVIFPDIFAFTPEEKAKVIELKTKALATYSDSSAFEIMPQEIFLREIIQLDKDTIEEIQNIREGEIFDEGNDDDI